jgi:hypothetical protein
LKAKAGELGLTIKNNLLEGVRYRDKFLREGGKGPSGVVFEPTARPMTLEERRNAAGRESALNAFLANTGNALSLGTAPAIEGLFDPNGAQTTRESLSAMRENSPWASMAGDVAGSIAPSGLAAKGLMATGRFTLPCAAGLADILTGTAQGAFENPEHPVAGGTLGGGSAALGALAGKYLINPVAQEGMDRIVSSRAPKPTFGEKTVAKQLGDPDEVVTALTDAERLGLPMGLADTTPEGQALARLSAQLSPKAADTADRFYPTRQAGRNERAAEAIERDVAPSVDLEARRQATRAEAQVAASPWYDRAYSQPAPIEDSVLKEVLSGRDARLAVSKAYDIAKNEGRDPTELGFVLNKKGEPELARGLTWESLDYVRQGISGLLEPKRNPLTGKLNLEKDPVARSQTTLLTRLTSRMDDLNPDYAAARAVYEEAVTPNNYLRRGIAAADAKVKPSEVERMLADVEALPPERQGAALENLRAGYATTLRDRALNRTETADGYTTAYGSKYQQEKMALLGISPEDFARQAELERKMAVTARDTTQGVKAEARDAAKKAMTPSDMAQIATETFLSGAPAITGANALMRLAAYNRGAWKYVGKGGQERQTRDAAKLADSLAPLLMGDDPSAALAILRASQGAVDRRAAAEMPVQAASIYGGGLLGKSGGLSLLNSGDYPSSDPYALAPSIPETEEQKRNRELFERYGMLPADMPL